MSYDQHHGTLFVLVGPGGTGKNTLMNAFMKNHPEVVKQLATATTRPKRDNEEHGREHLFVSLDEFRRMLANNELLEHQRRIDKLQRQILLLAEKLQGGSQGDSGILRSHEEPPPPHY